MFKNNMLTEEEKQKAREVLRQSRSEQVQQTPNSDIGSSWDAFDKAIVERTAKERIMQQAKPKETGVMDRILNITEGFGKGILSGRREASKTIKSVFDAIPNSVRGALATNPVTAPAFGAAAVASKVDPAMTALEKKVGAEEGSLTTAQNADQKVGKAAEFVGEVLMPVGAGAKAVKAAKTLDPFERALNSIIPKVNELSPTEYETLVKQTGRVLSKTKTSAAKIIPTKQEIELAKKYTNILQSKDPVKNAGNVLQNISKRDTEVGEFLAKTSKKFNKLELKSYLDSKLKDITDIMVPNEQNVQKAKDSLVNSLLKEVESDDLYGLWKGRKKFDSIIESRLKAFGGSDNLRKEVAREVRNGAQEFITEKLGDDFYKTKMSEMTDLFKVLDMVGNKATKEKNLSAIGKFLKDHPSAKKTIGWALSGIGAGTIIGSVID